MNVKGNIKVYDQLVFEQKEYESFVHSSKSVGWRPLGSEAGFSKKPQKLHSESCLPIKLTSSKSTRELKKTRCGQVDCPPTLTLMESNMFRKDAMNFLKTSGE